MDEDQDDDQDEDEDDDQDEDEDEDEDEEEDVDEDEDGRTERLKDLELRIRLSECKALRVPLVPDRELEHSQRLRGSRGRHVEA